MSRCIARGCGGKGAGALRQRGDGAFPHLPEEERLRDRELMKSFIERIFAYRRWKERLSADR
ncbi:MULTISPECIES: hypothetical protein [Geobacter]|uniref:hypothetical protein n=1 Tax=Geobacter TaxID=28231 RepID=UPI00003C6AD0|nr:MULTISPECIES: hypothetical protein [Geobacter]MBT1074778.1 hypothetical protein [Geobacter grbiciae]